jgi:prephenate dehydrogenase
MAEPDLFRDKVFVLSPLPRTAPQALALAQDLVRAIGARPLILDPERHDRLVAATSHLPYLLAVTLVRVAEGFAQEDNLLWRLAASGFRDTSRLAGTDITMMLDIIATNRGPILQALGRAQAELSALAQCLEQDDLGSLERALTTARTRRMEVYR